ncbi:hypothetical protein DPV78_010201 [Talaromyces pinophilus]|nr:hypothetical protein DPV78_010201 [Talaromyces pinophilus]
MSVSQCLSSLSTFVYDITEISCRYAENAKRNTRAIYHAATAECETKTTTPACPSSNGSNRNVSIESRTGLSPPQFQLPEASAFGDSTYSEVVSQTRVAEENP